MNRIVIKKGDVFVVKTDCYKRYFQYVVDDLTQLNSRIIKVFKESYPLNVDVNIHQIVQGEVDFYTHTMIRDGVRNHYWEKVGKAEIVDNIVFLFRSSLDYIEGNKVAVSNRWKVWHANDNCMKYIGKLTDEYKKAEIGFVDDAESVYIRIITGKVRGYYPAYE
ncbi:MAG: hypothetical protein Q4D29_13670 [Lachnospiraceae bacterium]|nr:hypothetical protein [Lachnospiraceae bacterium]